MVGSFIESQCPSVCMGRCETPTSGCHGNHWSKNILQILACDDTLKKGGISLFPRQINARLRTSLLWIVGELAGKGLWLWLLAVYCLHFNGTSIALQWHFNGTSMALPWHFHGTSTALPWHFPGNAHGTFMAQTKIVSVLLSALVERVSISNRRDFYDNVCKPETWHLDLKCPSPSLCSQCRDNNLQYVIS